MPNRHEGLAMMIGVDHPKWWGFRLLKTWMIRKVFFCSKYFFFPDFGWALYLSGFFLAKNESGNPETNVVFMRFSCSHSCTNENEKIVISTLFKC